MIRRIGEEHIDVEDWRICLTVPPPEASLRDGTMAELTRGCLKQLKGERRHILPRNWVKVISNYYVFSIQKNLWLKLTPHSYDVRRLSVRFA